MERVEQARSEARNGASPHLYPPGEHPAVPEPEREPEPEPKAETPTAAPEPSSAPARAAPASGRLWSLDAFRGLTILGMLLVNNMALNRATPRQLTHAPWNGGVYVADLVFPWFLLIVGLSMPFAYAAALRKGETGWQRVGKVLGRTLTLFLLGCLLDSSIARRPVLGLDVLQLIGLAYCAASLLMALPLWPRMVAAAVLLLGHWAVIRFLPVGHFAPGQFEASANVIAYLNEHYLAPLGLKGLVSVVPTTALVLIGTGLADLIRARKTAPARTAALLAALGVGLAGLGWLWNLDLPFNKPVWTGSYILFTAGLGALVFAGFYLVLDAWGRRGWAFPLVVFGSNAIFAYVVPVLVKVHILNEWTVPAAAGGTRTVQSALIQAAVRQFGPIWGGWFYTASYIFAWWIVLLVLYRKKLFLRV